MEPSPPQTIDWEAVEVVSWDLDGTLYSLQPVVAAFRRRILSDLFKGQFWGTLRAGFSLWRRLSTMRKVRDKGGIEGLPKPAETTHIKIKMADWHSAAVGDVGAQPGLIALLEAIDKSGKRQVVVTDYETEGKLDALKLPITFERIFEGEVLGAIKPSPELFKVILEELQVTPRALLHIGDRDESDGVAARGAGCQVLILGKDFEDFDSLHKHLFDRP